MRVLLPLPVPAGSSWTLPVLETPADLQCNRVQVGTIVFEEPAIPTALVRPLGVLFDGGEEAPELENFLAGLHAEKLLGARELPEAGKRRRRLAWVGVALRQRSRRLFAELRGGCWVRGFPVVGRARELLRAAGLADAAGLGAALREAGLAGALGATLYFNFHYGHAAGGCERVYVLDADERCLHGFALGEATNGTPLRACAGIL
jgi:hypothetical protein